MGGGRAGDDARRGEDGMSTLGEEALAARQRGRDQAHTDQEGERAGGAADDEARMGESGPAGWYSATCDHESDEHDCLSHEQSVLPPG